jgi:hypothetical protein
MKTAFTEYGVSTDELRTKLNGPNGLTDAMEYLSQKATKAGAEGTPAFAAALKLLMGTAPGANAALATVGANFDATSKAITGIGKASADSQGNVQGFAEIQGTLGQKNAELKATLDTLMIQLGDKLIPILKNVADFLLKHKDAVVEVTIAVVALLGVSMTLSVLMKGVTIATTLWSAATTVAKAVMWLMNDACIGTRLGLIALAIAQKASTVAQWLFNAALDANPIGIVIIALAALGAAMYLLVTHWKQVTDFVKKYSTEIEIALLAVLGPFGPLLAAALFLSQHWKQVFGDLRQWLWDDFGKKIETFFTDTIPRWFDTAVRDIKGAWNAVYDAIFKPIKNAYDDVERFISQLVSDIEAIPGKAASAASSAASSLLHAGGNFNPLNWFHAIGGIAGAAAGGPQGSLVRMNEQGGELVRLPTGSTVYPHANSMAMLNAAGSGGGGGGAVQLEVLPGGASAFEQFMVMALRQWVRARAGNAPNSVQKAFGQAF